jgi:hypothetical protein
MRKLLLPILVMLSAITTQVFAGDFCTPTTTSHLQCVFEIPAVVDGGSVVVESVTDHFSGKMTASCSKGKLSVRDDLCTPTKLSSCAVLSSVWRGEDGSSCSHKQESRPLPDGGTAFISSLVGTGEIKYKCKSGSLRILEKNCAKGDSDDAVLTTAERVNIPRSVTFIENVVETSCDTADVEAMIFSEFNSRSGEYDIEPSKVRVINEVCLASGYKELGSYNIANLGSIEDWLVSAKCESKIASTCDNTCIGREVDKAISIVPTICRTYSGVETCYENTCATPEIPESLCKNCDAGTFSYQGDNTGNTCTVTHDLLISGDQPTITFSNSTFNGSVGVLCNSGEKSKISGTCYKTCSGGAVSWADDYGQQSCGQTILAGEYYQDQTVTVTSALHHGGAVLKCDDGNWETVSGSCILDCNGSFSWGSGTSASGRDKSNACSAGIGFLLHGTQSVVKATSTAIGTDGSSHYSCNNGILTPSSALCELDCASQAVGWDGNNCSGTAPAVANDATANVNTSSFLSGFTGSANFSCSDGSLSLSGAGNCYSDCSASSFGVGSCSVSLPSGKHGATTEFYDLDKEGSYTCNDGTWEADEVLVCLAGLSSCGKKTMSWGAGCSGQVSNKAHGLIGTATSTVGSGEASYMCDNGTWKAEGGSTCSIDCSGSFSWGDGNACSASVGFLANGVDSKTTNTTSIAYEWKQSTDGCYKRGVMDTTTSRPLGSCSASQLGTTVDVLDRDVNWCPYRMESVQKYVCTQITQPSSGVKIASTSSADGSAYYSCNNGVFGTSGESCVTGCPSQSVNWSAPSPCSGTLSAGQSGDTQTVYDSATLGNGKFLREGEKSYKCEGGVWNPTNTGNTICKIEEVCGDAGSTFNCD